MVLALTFGAAAHSRTSRFVRRVIGVALTARPEAGVARECRASFKPLSRDPIARPQGEWFSCHLGCALTSVFIIAFYKLGAVV